LMIIRAPMEWLRWAAKHEVDDGLTWEGGMV
jgi:hypothetical protein